MDNGQQATFSVSGWLPNGMKVYFSIPMPDGVSAFDQAMMFTNDLLEKGFRQHEPGLEEGEQRETINMVARRNKLNDDGTNTPVLDLYVNNDKMKHRFIAVYLNTDEDVQSFETVSGVKLASIPLNPTKAPVDRDVKEFTLQTKPFGLIYTNNPNYDEAKDSMKPKRLFVRWDSLKSNEKGSNSNAPAEPAIVDADAWDKTAVEQFVTHYLDRLDVAKLLGILKVTRFGEWTQGKKAAYVAVEKSLAGAA